MPSKPREKARLDPSMVESADQTAEAFPAVRYFQIHFEFLQEQIQLILRNQESLQQQMLQLESRLSRSGQGIRVNTRTMSPLERLAGGRNTVQELESPSLNRTLER